MSKPVLKSLFTWTPVLVLLFGSDHDLCFSSFCIVRKEGDKDFRNTFLPMKDQEGNWSDTNKARSRSLICTKYTRELPSSARLSVPFMSSLINSSLFCSLCLPLWLCLHRIGVFSLLYPPGSEGWWRNVMMKGAARGRLVISCLKSSDFAIRELISNSS